MHCILRRSTNETRRRDWLNGVRLELWDPPKRTPGRDPPEGQTSSPEQAFELRLPRDVGPGAVLVIDPDMVRKALSSFAPISGARPSGLRPSHLQEALRHSSGDRTLRLISEVVQLMLRGEIPEDIRPWICGASLMALRKPNGPLRPVAVGESLRRLCSKVAVELMGSSVRSILEPTQVGVQTKAGCEAVTHTTRQWTQTVCDDPDRVLVLLDLSNAFNCVSRGAVLSAVRRHFPWMTPWADTCYRHDSNLLVGSSRIRSRRGVQQGDPLGPSLFSLAVHPCVIEATRVSEAQFPLELDYKAFFLDDGTIAGKAQAVQLFLDSLERLFLEIGLEIARNKTKVILACSAVQNFTHLTISRAAVGCRMVISSSWGLLSVPRNGAKLFSIGESTKLVHCSRPSADTTILRGPSPSCALARDGCRTVPPPLQAAGLGNADRDIRHSLGRLVGSPLSDEDWRLASFGVAAGGLGARSAVEHAPAAYVSILAQSQELCARIWPGFDEYDIDGGLQRADTESSLFSSFPPQRQHLRVLRHPFSKELVGQDRSKSLPAPSRSLFQRAPPLGSLRP